MYKLTIDEYINRVTGYPFVSWVYDANHPMPKDPYFVHSQEFQESFKQWVSIKYGEQCFFERLTPELKNIDENSTTEEFDAAIASIAARIRNIFETHYTALEYQLRGLLKTTQFEYNPIWNVDGTEHLVTSDTYDENHSESIGAQTSEGDTTQGDTANGSTTQKVSPDDSNNYNDYTKADTASSSSATVHSSSTLGARSDAGQKHEAKSFESTLTRGGNIGVTMTQQLIEAERKVLVFNIYDVVSANTITQIASLIYGGI